MQSQGGGEASTSGDTTAVLWCSQTSIQLNCVYGFENEAFSLFILLSPLEGKIPYKTNTPFYI